MRRMLGWMAALAAVTMLAACGSAKPTVKAPPTPPVLKPTLADFTLNVDGKPMPIVGGAAMTEGSSAVVVVLSTAPLKCADFTPDGRATAEGQRDVIITFSPRVQDGKQTLVPHSVELDGRGIDDKDALKGLTLIASDVNGPVAFDAAIETTDKANDFLNRPERAVALKGKAVVVGCGAKVSSISADMTPDPQPKATLTFGGVTQTIRGATLNDEKLRLSTSPLSCDIKGRTDLYIEVELPSKYEPKHKISASGDLANANTNGLVGGKPAEGETAKEWFSVELGQKADKRRTAQVAGQFEAFGQQVVIEGTIDAQACR